MKLGLGAVQFGVDYGVSNKNGLVTKANVLQILNEAQNEKISIIDTASLYGKSEEILGQTFTSDMKFDIVTKSPVYHEKPINENDVVLLIDTFHKSLIKLRTDSIYGLLIHHVDDLLSSGGVLLVEALQLLQQEGLVKKIGVSVYNATQIDALLSIMTPDIIQLPLNPFDQRLLTSGHIQKLKDLGVELHARSLFLQGLLLMNAYDISEYFKPISSHIKAYEEHLITNKLSKLEGALCFINQLPQVEIGLVGVTTVVELKQIIQAYHNIKNCNVDFSSFAINDESFINPVKWKID